MKNQLFGYVSLPLGVIALVVGIHFSHDTPLGYIGILAGIVLGFVSFRALKQPSASTE